MKSSSNITKSNSLTMQQSDYFSSIFRILGSLAYTKPCEYKNNKVDLIFTLETTDIPELDDVLNQFKTANKDELDVVYDELFAGIGDMAVPPWGSVYLDKENVVFGNSTLHYRQFLTQLDIEFTAPNNDPEDHIGLMLMMVSMLLERDDAQTALKTLLSEHILPWAYCYLNHFNKVVDSKPYLALMFFIKQELESLQHALAVKAVEKQIYFNTHE